jgi:hypothetical protein
MGHIRVLGQAERWDVPYDPETDQGKLQAHSLTLRLRALTHDIHDPLVAVAVDVAALAPQNRYL